METISLIQGESIINTAAKKIMDDMNMSLAKEAHRRNVPSITMSAGAVLARHWDTYTNLKKAADAALYEAKATHNGGFASTPVLTTGKKQGEPKTSSPCHH